MGSESSDGVAFSESSFGAEKDEYEETLGQQEDEAMMDKNDIDNSLHAPEEARMTAEGLQDARDQDGLAVEVDGKRDSAYNSMSSSAEEMPTDLPDQAVELLKSAVNDIKSGRHSGQLPTADREARFQEADLKDRAGYLLQRMANGNGLTSSSKPSARSAAEMQAIANEYYSLAGWLQPGEIFIDKRLNVDFRSQNGSVHSIACDLRGSVGDLKRAIRARGVCGAGPQLLCNGQPMTNDAQGLYELSARHGLGLRRGVHVQEVVRNVGG